MVSLEMPASALMQRLLMKLFGVNRKILKEMLKSPEGATYIMKARDILEKYLYIIDVNSLTMDDIKYRVEVANEKIFDKPVKRVFVDYFQYMKNTNEFIDIFYVMCIIKIVQEQRCSDHRIGMPFFIILVHLI